MKLLVLATDYPKQNESVALMYIHTRNKYYVQNGFDVTVINFRARMNYLIDGVKVITLREYQTNQNKYDILISHAPNIRNHFLFLNKYSKNFSDIVFFFHGHEVLKISDTYPEPYGYMKKIALFSLIIQELYDSFKLRLWNNYLRKILNNAHFIFVSKWMHDMFIKYVQLDPNVIKSKSHIIYNSVGKNFEKYDYDTSSEKEFDFITIRNNLDDSKYSIDIVSKIANSNSNYKFCVIGKGQFFQNNEKPNNLIWIDKNLRHDEVISYLNKSKCALMPTRTDAQGVMACEMATFGIPLITSDIEVCKEVFTDFENIGFIDNEEIELDITPIYEKLLSKSEITKRKKYFAEYTIGKEIELFKKINIT
ncbi:glycosyltransferase [Paenibacillus validus]|uniref:glycosyltransferase n=1 Tax=Paenibacillus validus TaxID=44253 RepID=UPI000FD81B5E|nr:glycosyltransferase [Paenibacillus validus]MED4600758.1 glycosyltransferase [Paenibacillus validus]MED4606171.1 glycosyltransferase [Paenibacillus validus]